MMDLCRGFRPCLLPLRNVAVAASSPPREAEQSKSYLSDLIAFESDKEKAGNREDAPSQSVPSTDAQQLVERAEAALESARQALENSRQRAPSRPTSSAFTYSSSRQESRAGGRGDKHRDSQAATRSALEAALSSMPDADEEGDAVGSREEGAPPAWAGGLSQPAAKAGLKLQPAATTEGGPALDFAEPSFATLELPSQAKQDAERARGATLPPLQSVLELSTAAEPPQRGEVMGEAAPSPAGMAMEDGEGVLGDGTRYVRQSGEEKGRNGYWHRWTRLQGVSANGKVEWEETWWESSDWAGMKEMGAEKSGCRADGAAWRETWREAIAFDASSGEPMVERTAHKWAHDAKGDEWEEKWGEHYWSKGRASKWADKWAKAGANVWHERWGEDYDGQGDGCVKYTDKWAERRLEGGGSEQWGEKWEERFGGGKGNKNGETWSIDGGGGRYQRWWGENHFGDGWVQKYGNSTTGESWDVSERMDTYYNPVPHFGYKLAMDHSPQLKGVGVLPRGGDELGEGIDAL